MRPRIKPARRKNVVHNKKAAKQEATDEDDRKDSQVGVELHVVFLEAFADATESFVHRIGELQHFVFVWVDHAPAHHGAKVQHLIPIFAAINNDQIVARQLSRLQQGEHFPEFVHGAEAAGKNDERFGDLREPKFAHEEVVKIEAQLGADVGVGELLVGQLDGQADGFSAGFGGAAVGGFHDAGTAAGANHKAARTRAERKRPGGDAVGKFARFFVVARHFQGALCLTDGFAVLRALRGGQL